MHRRYFPRCPVDGPILPAMPFCHLGLKGSVPAKCSACAHLFEGECRRFAEQKGYMALDHGSCEVDGPTDPVKVDNEWICSKVEVPRKCSTCVHLQYDAIRGFTCSAQQAIWGWFSRGLDWGTWSPERLYVDLAPYRATREMIDAATEGRHKEFIVEFRSHNPNESLVTAQEAYHDARRKLASFEPGGVANLPVSDGALRGENGYATYRTDLVQRLGELMSQVSEDCYCAGWLGGTEYFIPELCRRTLTGARPQPWGHGCVTIALARTLCDIAEQLGHWVDTDEASVGYVPFSPFPIPPEYIAALDRELELNHPCNSARGTEGCDT